VRRNPHANARLQYGRAIVAVAVAVTATVAAPMAARAFTVSADGGARVRVESRSPGAQTIESLRAKGRNVRLPPWGRLPPRAVALQATIVFSVSTQTSTKCPLLCEAMPPTD